MMVMIMMMMMMMMFGKYTILGSAGFYVTYATSCSSPLPPPGCEMMMSQKDMHKAMGGGVG